MIDRIEGLYKLGLFHSDSIYATCSLVLQSKEEDDIVWLMHAFGGNKEGLIRAIHGESMYYPSSGVAEKILKLLVFKHILGIPNNHLGYIFQSGVDFYITGLDQVADEVKEGEGKEEKLEPSVAEEGEGKEEKLDRSPAEEKEGGEEKLEQNTEEEGKTYESFFCSPLKPVESMSFKRLDCLLKKFPSPCLEYMAIWGDTILKVFGQNSVENQRWLELEARLRKTVFAGVAEPNPKRFGWPVKSGDRVMFAFNRQSDEKNYPATMNWDEPEPAFCGEYRGSWKVKIDDEFRYILHAHDRLHDTYAVLPQLVRHMTDEEKKIYLGEQNKAYRYFRGNSYLAYGPGDIVKIYEQDWNDENASTGVPKRDTVKLNSNPKDVGLVLSDMDSNRYWKSVYCFKSKSIGSFPCRRLYWIPDQEHGGRALFIPDVKSLLEEDSPLKILKAHLKKFAHLL